jgi:hypothetical protein
MTTNTANTLVGEEQREDAPPVDIENEPEQEKRTRKVRSDKGIPKGPYKPRVTGGKRSSHPLRGKIKDLLDVVAFATTSVNPEDGLILANNTDKLADAYAPIVAKNRAMSKALEGMYSGSLYGGAIVATLTVVLAIAAGHESTRNMLPPSMQYFGLQIRNAQLQGKNKKAADMPFPSFTGFMGGMNGGSQTATSEPVATGSVPTPDGPLE